VADDGELSQLYSGFACDDRDSESTGLEVEAQLIEENDSSRTGFSLSSFDYAALATIKDKRRQAEARPTKIKAAQEKKTFLSRFLFSARDFLK
jgi:hypothetical protein